LAIIGRLMQGNTDQMNMLLQEYFSNANEPGRGFFDCASVPDQPLGLLKVSINVGYSPLGLCPSYWKSAGKDLNAGAFGKYVELCQQYGEALDPVTGITVVAGENAQCPKGYERDIHNLNEGTRTGDRLYLCVGHEPGTPLMEIKATSDKTGGNKCEAGWKWLDVNLNQGTRGNYVYLCYR